MALSAEISLELHSAPITEIIEIIDLARNSHGVTLQKLVRQIVLASQSIDSTETLRLLLQYFLIEHLLSHNAVPRSEFGTDEYLMTRHAERSDLAAKHFATPLRKGLTELGCSIAVYETYKNRMTTDVAVVSTDIDQTEQQRLARDAALQFMRTRGKITRHVSHRYTHDKVFTSDAAYNKKTYCEIHGLPELPQPSDAIGLFDRRNHGFLIYPNKDSYDEFCGKRITIDKLTDIQFALLAMQVASGRTTMMSPDDIDPAFGHLLSVFKGEQQLLGLIPHPSCLLSRQQCEILFSFIYANVLIHVDDDLRNLCFVVQDFWFHGGARVSKTKQNGWAQNPRGLEN